MKKNGKLLNQVSASGLFIEFEKGSSAKELSAKYGVSPEAILQTLRQHPKKYYAIRRKNKLKTQKERWQGFSNLINHFKRLPTVEEAVFLLGLEKRKQYDDLVQHARKKGYKSNAVVGFKREQKRKDMLIFLKELAKKLGYTPGMKDIDKTNKYWGSSYSDAFGSLRKAQKMAGLKPVSPGNSKDRLARYNK